MARRLDLALKAGKLGFTELEYASDTCVGLRRLNARVVGWQNPVRALKTHVFEVHASDLARRSFVVGQAVIENSESRAATADVTDLFRPAPDPTVYVIARRLLGERQALFVASAIPAIGAAPEPQYWLFELTLLKRLLRCFPMSIPAASDARYGPN